MPMIAIGTGTLLAGGAGSYFGGKQQSQAQQSIAQAQLGQAQATQQQALSYAQPNQYDIQSLQDQLNNYQNTYGLQQAQLQRDTSLAELSGQNVSQLLQGQAAPTMQPYLNVVGTQKQQLMSDLARQLGPGWENTTAGQQALQNFNQQSSMQASQLQQQYLGTQMANQLAQSGLISGEILGGGQTLGGLARGVGQTAQAQQGLQISALEGTNITPYAGASSVGQLGMGATLSQLGGGAMGAGSTLATLGAYQSAAGGAGGGGGGGASGFSGLGSYWNGQNPYGATG